MQVAGIMYSEEKILNVLHNVFQLEQFRPGQIEIINSILSRKDTFAVLPTGGGKSLCFQLPAVMSEGTALVVSPLISLMKDQVDALKQKGISATYLNSSISDEAQKVRLAKLTNGDYKLLYIAPERISSSRFTNALQKSNVSILIVDEAHCISEWGHNFRPNYLKIKEIFNYIPKVPIAAFTATATPEVQKDIVKYLQMNETQVYVRGFARENLAFQTEIPKNKNSRLLELLNLHKKGSKIIYVGSRKATVKVAEFLNEKNIPALAYNGGMEINERKEIQEKFLKNETNLIVATNAFGMGIDKPDVRLVVHLDLPSTLEAYYQEGGRAGRDGKSSDCFLLYAKNDESLPSLFIFGAFPDARDLRKVTKGILDIVETSKNFFIQGKVTELAHKFNITSNKLTVILKLLNRKDYIKFYDDSHFLQYSIIAENDDMQKITKNFHQNRSAIFQYLYHLGKDKKYAQIDLKEIASEFAITLESLHSEISSFDSLGLINIQKDRTYSGLKLLRSDLAEEEVLDKLIQDLEFHKQLLITKADKVLDYLRTDRCKQEFILDYFGESSPEYKCGKCTSCVFGPMDISGIEDAHIHNYEKKISRKAIKDRELYDKISLHLPTSNSIDDLAKKMKLTNPELANLMQSAIEDGWLVTEIKFIPNDLIKELTNLLNKNSNLRLSQIRERLNSEVEFPELRVAVAIARMKLGV